MALRKLAHPYKVRLKDGSYYALSEGAAYEVPDELSTTKMGAKLLETGFIKHSKGADAPPKFEANGREIKTDAKKGKGKIAAPETPAPPPAP